MAGSNTDPDPFESTTAKQEGVLGDEARNTIREHASPEGVVTILFTDIVESTRFRQRFGDAAAQERLREHNAVVREQIAKHGGFEVKTQGDGFMIAFGDAVAALACAVDIQKAVAKDNERHPGKTLRVRMGLNCGQAIKEEEDFFGGVVIVASRICGMARADQILVSEAVRVLAGLPPGIGYVRYGQRRLKGLADSYGIWSVPWSGVELRVFERLRINSAVRLATLFILPLGVAGGVLAGVLLLRGDGGSGATGHEAPRELAFSYKAHSVARVVSGDCKTQDLVVDHSVVGDVSGELTGRVTGSGEITAYVSDSCQTGYSPTDLTLTDGNQNSITGTLEGPLNAITLFTAAAGAQTKAGYGTSVFTVTGGSGLYAGATGTATCNGVLSGHFQPDGSVLGDTEGNCLGQLATEANSVVAPDPLVVQLAATPLKVAVSGQAFDPANTVRLAVVYGNTRDTAEHGLTLRVREPEGVRILASALGGPVMRSEGDPTWKLPDIAPGELKRFEFRLSILSAQGSAVPVTAQIDGEGFERPVGSNVVAIEVSG